MPALGDKTNAGLYFSNTCYDSRNIRTEHQHQGERQDTAESSSYPHCNR